MYDGFALQVIAAALFHLLYANFELPYPLSTMLENISTLSESLETFSLGCMNSLHLVIASPLLYQVNSQSDLGGKGFFL